MFRILALGAWTLALASCQSAVSTPAPTPTPTPPPGFAQNLTVGANDWTTDNASPAHWWAWEGTADLDKTRTLSLSVTPPAGGAKLFYLFTNTSSSGSDIASLAWATGRGLPSPRPSRGVAVGGLPHRLSLHDRVAAPLVPPAAGSRSLVAPPMGSFVKGDTTNFIDSQWDSSTTATPKADNIHPSHLRTQVVKTTASGTHTLNVWVADDCWSADGTTLALSQPATAAGTSPTTAWVPPAHLVTQAMADALAAAFLTDGTNDIYGWVTSLVGSEWPMSGAPVYQGATMVTAGGNLHIFVCNLNPGSTSAGILEGYFHANNNFVGYTGSNGKVLFAVDADSLANPSPDGSTAGTAGSWAITAYWPSEIRSTLAHEFQHMIHFYQKQVKQNLSQDTDAWINEMASMVTEDLVADKLGVPGPRGLVSLAAGTAKVSGGRFPDFVSYHDVLSLTGWGTSGDPTSDNWTLESYANAYAFGSWLVRNYGGPALLGSLVSNNLVDAGAVVAAVNANGGTGETFASLVRHWGLAVFLGNSSTAPFQYSNGGNPFSWSGGSFRAGEINVAAYWDSYTNQLGPYVFPGVLPSGAQVYPGATLFDRVETLSGPVSHTLTLPPNVALTVVVTP